jgi:hypothetical protein
MLTAWNARCQKDFLNFHRFTILLIAIGSASQRTGDQVWSRLFSGIGNSHSALRIPRSAFSNKPRNYLPTCDASTFQFASGLK